MAAIVLVGTLVLAWISSKHGFGRGSEVLEDVGWRDRQRIVRAVARGREVDDSADAELAVRAAREMRQQHHGTSWLRWWLAAGAALTFGQFVARLADAGLTPTQWLTEAVIPGLALGGAAWWYFGVFPRRLERAEKANRCLADGGD